MKALVLGGARCVWRDADAALKLFRPDVVVACNDAGADWPGHLDVWVTLHNEKFHVWQNRRAREGRNTDYVAVTHLNASSEYPGRIDVRFPHTWPEMTASGSSGHFAMKAALGLGATHVVLCGVPMDPTQAHYFDAAKWHEWESFIGAWHRTLHRLGNVRSMSGWTRDRLGAPTREWLGAKA